MDDSSDLSDDELSTPPSSDDDATDDGEIHEVPAKKPRSPPKKEPLGTLVPAGQTVSEEANVRRALGYVASHWSAHGSMNGLKASTVRKLVAPPMETTTVTNAPRSPEAVLAAAPAVPRVWHLD